MTDQNRIRTVIINNDKQFLCALKNHLELFPDIELRGCAIQYHHAKRLILTEKPELVFLDIDMPDRDGFELLTEIRSLTTNDFSVVFHTSDEKNILKALRLSAFDCLLNPVKEEDIDEIVQRFREKRNKLSDNAKFIQQTILYVTDMISLPTHIGIRFVDLGNIVLFLCKRETPVDKPCWEVLLNDEEHIRLKRSTTSKEIMKMVKDKFVQINPAVVVNINYINVIEFKTQECVLIPPFQQLRFRISRSQMTGIREKYDLL